MDTNLKSFAEKHAKYFPENEWENRYKIISLIEDWKKEISTKDKILFYDDGKEYPPEDYFYYDGFFPNYYNQDTKVLFIAREARYVSGKDFVEDSIDLFKSGKNLNEYMFWKRIFYMLYGIRTKGKWGFDNIPYPHEFVQELNKTNDYGFAVMNMSKYSNDREDGAKADTVLMNRFLKDSNLNKRNFFKEELAILDPDVIITANLWDGKINEEYLDICFNQLNSIKFNADSMEGALHTMQLNNKSIKLIDLYHFSKPGSDKDYYYNPIVQLLFKDG